MATRMIRNKNGTLIYFSCEEGIFQIGRAYVESYYPYKKGYLTIERQGLKADGEFEVIVYLEDCFDDPSRRGICLEDVTTITDWKRLTNRIFHSYDVDDFAKEIDEKIETLELEANLGV